MESAGIEPAAFRMPSERSSTNPRPQYYIIRKHSQIIKFYYFWEEDIFFLIIYCDLSLTFTDFFYVVKFFKPSEEKNQNSGDNVSTGTNKE